MMGLCFHSNPLWVGYHSEIGCYSGKKRFCEESDLLYMIKDQTLFQGSFNEI